MGQAVAMPSPARPSQPSTARHRCEPVDWGGDGRTDSCRDEHGSHSGGCGCCARSCSTPRFGFRVNALGVERRRVARSLVRLARCFGGVPAPRGCGAAVHGQLPRSACSARSGRRGGGPGRRGCSLGRALARSKRSPCGAAGAAGSASRGGLAGRSAARPKSLAQLDGHRAGSRPQATSVFKTAARRIECCAKGAMYPRTAR